MITRIHGATSTLAANPAKKKHKAKAKGTKRKKTTTRVAASARRAAPRKAKAKSTKKRVARAPARKVFAVYRRAAKSKTGKSILPYRLARNPRKKKAVEEVIVAAPAAEETKKKGGKRRTGPRSPIFAVYTAGKGKNRKYMVRRNPRHHRRNPALMLAGVPVIEMAIGSAATIAISATAKGLIDNVKALEAVKTSPIGDIAGELVTAGVAWALHDKVLTNPMHKSIAQYAFVGAVFQILSKKLSDPIKGLVEKIPGVKGMGGYSSAMSGVYFDPYTAAPAVGGYISADAGQHMAGIYTDVNAMSGLFDAPSIYG